MIHTFTLPELGDGVSHAIIQRWHQAPLNTVTSGDILLEITADKATILLEAPADGALLCQCAKPGDWVPVGGVLAAIGPEGHGVPADISGVNYPQAQAGACMLHRPSLDAEPTDGQIQPLNAMREVIATRMTQSKADAPHFYVTSYVDMSACIELRTRLKKEAKARVTYNDMIIKACALALVKHPQVAAVYTDAGYLMRKRRNIGFAVAVEPDGLVVPVIRDTDRRALVDVASCSKELADKARKHKLRPADYTGGVFTVSNLSSLDVESFIAIVNPGESAILAIGKLEDKPVAIKGEVQIRPMMSITLSSDHRVIDGLLAAKFNQTVKKLLESPDELIAGHLMGG
jgi:pyruvate dehydrogenase E2 component (dihydrolipoamide acetyltransferase)